MRNWIRPNCLLHNWWWNARRTDTHFSSVGGKLILSTYFMHEPTIHQQRIDIRTAKWFSERKNGCTLSMNMTQAFALYLCIMNMAEQRSTSRKLSAIYLVFRFEFSNTIALFCTTRIRHETLETRLCHKINTKHTQIHTRSFALWYSWIKQEREYLYKPWSWMTWWMHIHPNDDWIWSRCDALGIRFWLVTNRIQLIIS